MDGRIREEAAPLAGWDSPLVRACAEGLMGGVWPGGGEPRRAAGPGGGGGFFYGGAAPAPHRGRGPRPGPPPGGPRPR